MGRSTYMLAHKLSQSDDIDGVRACDKRITVAFAPQQKAVEGFSHVAYDAVMSLIEKSEYQHEYGDADRFTCEKHRVVGGNHNPVLRGSDMPAGYELQMSFVK